MLFNKKFTVLYVMFCIVWTFSTAIRFQLTPAYLRFAYHTFPIELDSVYGRNEKQQMAEQVVQYLLNPIQNLRILSGITGSEIGISIAEQNHLLDVKTITLKFVRLHMIGTVGFLLMIGYFIATKKFRRLDQVFYISLKFVGIGFLGIVVACVFFWNFFFTFFHQVLFPQGNWQFPEDSLLIRIFPETFWVFNFISTFALTLFIIWFCRAMIARLGKKLVMTLNDCRIALIYDRVNTPFGGAEQVLSALHELFPEAPLFTSVYDPETAQWANDFEIHASFLQTIPFAKTHHREFVALMPKAFESFDLDEFDIIISINSAEAKGVRTQPHQLHISYVLTPTRYLWSHHLEYEKGFLKPIKAFIFSQLRLWDFKAAQRPQHLLAISQLVTQRVEKYYKRQIDEIIYPPYVPFEKVDELKNDSEPFFLIVSRLVEYKNIDLAIQICIKNNWTLKIVGNGPDKARLEGLVKKLNGQQIIDFIENVDRRRLGNLYSQAKAFLLPNEEDFGISALEALSQGCPVITSHRSGVAELIQDKITGLLCSVINEVELEKAVQHTFTIKWNKAVIAQSVVGYNKDAFRKKFLKTITQLWENHRMSFSEKSK